MKELIYPNPPKTPGFSIYQGLIKELSLFQEFDLILRSRVILRLLHLSFRHLMLPNLEIT